MRLSANPTVRNGIPSEDKGAIRRQGCRPQKKRLVIPSSTGGGREPPRAAGLLDQRRLRRFGDVAPCARIPRSGRLGALSSPSGRFKRTLWETFWGRSVMRQTVGHLTLRPRSVRARRAGRRTSSRAKPGQIRLRPRSVRAGPAPGHPPSRAKGPPPGDAGDGLGKGGRRPGEAAAPREGARPGRPSPNRDGARAGRAARSPRSARGGRPAPRAARASRRPSWSPAPRPAAPTGAARSRRSARRCRSRR